MNSAACRLKRIEEQHNQTQVLAVVHLQIFSLSTTLPLVIQNAGALQYI